MGKINVLSFEVANLIAAGEVVDRPASAIKEMIENSIDAGAKNITIETQDGGVTYMRVTDDGCGMTEEDLPIALRRHATSKIKCAEDLEQITTLGFRGEALAAISSVSKIRIMSKTEDEDVGHLLEADCGHISSITECGCKKGTTIIAEQLFANVPARRKFLKRDVTETMAVVANVEKIAMSHPEIAIKLICDGTLKLETVGDGSLKNAIYAVYGRDFVSRLIEISGENDGIKVSGFIGRTDNVKANRNSQNVFINNRYVKSKTVSAALEQAYTSYCPVDRFPVCILFLTLSPMRVDVNVHPAKLEVKFSNEKPVFEAVYFSVRSALEANATRPELKTDKPSSFDWSKALGPIRTSKQDSMSERQMPMTAQPRIVPDSTAFTTMSAQDYRKTYLTGEKTQGVHVPGPVYPVQSPIPPKQNVTSESKEHLNMSLSSKAEIPYEEETVKQQPVDTEIQPVDNLPTVNANKVPEVPTEAPVTEPALPEYRICGEVFNTYLIVELKDKMLLIDKHAAHERINFESMKAALKTHQQSSQFLMIPAETMMTSSEISALESYRNELESIGFSFRTARNTVYTEAIPSQLEEGDVSGILQAMAAQILEGTGMPTLTRDIIFEKALYQASCKASIKGGREYTAEHIEWLVKKIMELPDITFCPHGRPIALEMTKNNLDHQFERK